MELNIKYPKAAGIYKLTCSNNGKIYIGKTINLHRRLREHKNCEKKNEGNCYFQNAIIKYGWNSFIVEILEVFENFDKLTDNKKLLEQESHYIKMFDSSDLEKGYNICKYSSDRTGTICSEESKEKMRKAKRGRVLSEEHRSKLKYNRLGKKMSEESKEKIRQYRLGKTLSEESKRKLSLDRSGKKGHKVSEETKEKMRNAKLGKSCSEETKEKIRQAKRKKINKEVENE